MNDPEDFVRRMLDAHDKGGDALLEAFGDFFASDVEWRPIIAGTAGSERVTYRGRDGLERYWLQAAHA